MLRRAFLIGGVVLAARLLTFPRTPWDAEELQYPFALMVGISIAASALTAAVFAMREPAAALLFSLSAAVMVHGVTATTDALAWMFIVVAWAGGTSASSAAEPGASHSRGVGRRIGERGAAVLLGVCCAAAIACRPAFVFSVLALLMASMVTLRKRERILAMVAFATVIVPFVRIPEELALPHDFSIARFLLHPWGSKFSALPVLILAAAGARPLLKRWSSGLEVLGWFTLVHLAVGIALVDPRDGVRYVVPALLFVAIAAAEAFPPRWRWAGATGLAVLSIVYAYPLLRERVTRPSPLVQAMRARGSGTEVVDGKEGGIVFSRSEADPWGKLTRNAYRHASVVPLPLFQPGVGVYGVERNEQGESWRWLERHAELRAPAPVRLTLRLPAEAKIEGNDVRVNGALVRIRRGESVTVNASARVEIEAAREFPLDAPDTREVAVQLLRVER